MLAPSGRPADLAGRRALARGDGAETIAIGTAVPVSRRSSLGVPVGVRANLRLALQQGRFDVVHGFEPGLPSISYLALRDSEALGSRASSLPTGLGYPPRRALREKLLARIDALSPPRRRPRRQPPSASPATTGSSRPGSTPSLFGRGEAEAGRDRAPLRLAAGGARGPALVEGAARLGGGAAADEAAVDAPRDPARASRRCPRPVRPPPRPAPRCSEAAIVVPAPTGSARLRLEASAAGAALADPPGVLDQPELAAAAVHRLAENGEVRERKGKEARAAAESQSFAAVARELEAVHRSSAASARAAGTTTRCPGALDPRRPAHAHLLVARLLDRGRRTARPRPGRGPRGDRRHRPQRLRRRPRGCRGRHAAVRSSSSPVRR